VKKVYCKNCKHLGYWNCKDTHIIKYRDWYDEYESDSPGIRIKNKNNNCKWFEKK